MLFFGRVNDLEFFLRWIVTTARALIWRLASASAFLNTNFLLFFFFLFFLNSFLLTVFSPLLFQPEPFSVFPSLGMLGFLKQCLFGFALFCLALFCFAFHCDACCFFCLLDVALFMLIAFLADDCRIIFTLCFEWKANVNYIKMAEDVIDDYDDDFDDAFCFASSYEDNILP